MVSGGKSWAAKRPNPALGSVDSLINRKSCQEVLFSSKTWMVLVFTTCSVLGISKVKNSLLCCSEGSITWPIDSKIQIWLLSLNISCQEKCLTASVALESSPVAQRGSNFPTATHLVSSWQKAHHLTVLPSFVYSSQLFENSSGVALVIAHNSLAFSIAIFRLTLFSLYSFKSQWVKYFL